jgi:hypothetical protein
MKAHESKPPGEAGPDPALGIWHDYKDMAEAVIASGSGRELWEVLQREGPASEYGESMQKLGQNVDINLAMVMNSIYESTWSTVDALMPRSTRDSMKGQFSLQVKYMNEEDKKFREKIGLSEQVNVSAWKDDAEMSQQQTSWLGKYLDWRLGQMKEAGVSDEAISTMEHLSEFEAIGIEFALAPDLTVLRGKRALAGINKLVKAAGDTPSPADIERVKVAVDRVSRFARTKGQFADEAVKGAFVGFYSGHGDAREKTQEALIWAGLGAGFGTLTKAWRAWHGANATPAFHKMLTSTMTPQEAAATLEMGINAESKGAMMSLLKHAGDSVELKNLRALRPVPVNPRHQPIIEQHTAMLREIEELNVPIELRLKNAMREQEGIAARAEREGMPFEPIPEEVIAKGLLEKSDDIPKMEQAMRELESQNPEIFPNPSKLPDHVEGEIVLKDKSRVKLKAEDTYESSLKAEMAHGDQVKHNKFGTGTIVGKSGDKWKVQFAEGTKPLQAHKSWGVQREMISPTYTHYDRIRFLVEQNKMSHRKAHIYLVQSRLEANDPAAYNEAINMMLDDLFNTPKLMTGPEGWSANSLNMLADYMKNPFGKHPGFQWGDLNVIRRTATENGHMPIFTVPYNAWDEMGQMVPKGGPRGRAYGHLPPEQQQRILLEHQNAMHTYKGEVEEGAAQMLVTEKGMPHASASFDEELALLYDTGGKHMKTDMGEDVLITSFKERLGEKGFTVENKPPPGMENLPYVDDILMVYPVKGFTEEMAYINLEMRRVTDIGFTLEQQRAHWKEASEFLQNRDNWALIKPEVPPAVYADETANTLSRYVKNAPALGEGLETFHPKKSNMGIINPAVNEVHGVPATSEATGDILATAAAHLDRPPTGLSLVQKKTDGAFEIVAGPGEKRAHEMLKDEIEQEFAIFTESPMGQDVREGLFAKYLRTELEIGERAQRMVKNLHEMTPKTYENLLAEAKQIAAEKGVVRTTSRDLTPTERVLLKASDDQVDEVTGLLNEPAMEYIMANGSEALMRNGERVGVARAYASNMDLALKILSKDESKVLFQRIGKAFRKVADKHALVIGRGSKSRFTLFGQMDSPVAVKKDLNKSFRDLLDDAPEVMKLFYGKDGPTLLTPAFGTAVGRDIPVKTLIEEADAFVHEMNLLLKSQAAADGWMVSKGFARPKALGDGRFEFTAESGEKLIVKAGDGTLWEEISYARIMDTGGIVKAKDGKWVVIKNGNIDYAANNPRQIALMESVSDPFAEVSLNNVMSDAFSDIKGIPGGPGLGQPTSPLEMAPAINPKLRGHGEWLQFLWTPTKTIMDKVEKNTAIPAGRWYNELERQYQVIAKVFNSKKLQAWEAGKGHSSRKTQGFVAQVLLQPKGEQTKLIKDLSSKDQEYFQNMRKMFHELWDEIGVPKEYHDDVLHMVSARIGGQLPKVIAEEEWFQSLSPIFSAYELKALNVDVAAIHAKLWRSHLRQKYMVPEVKRIRDIMKDIPSEEIPVTSRKAITRMVELFDSTPDHDFLAFGELATDAIRRLPGLKGDTARTIGEQIPALMLSTQYFASMAFRLGLPLRNLFQPWITTAPFIGVRDTAAGWKLATALLKKDDKAFESLITGKVSEDVLKEWGILQEYLPVASGEVVSSLASAKGYINQVHKWTRKGLYMQAKTDKLNRLVSFYGSVNRSSRYLKKALDGKKDFEWFAAHADLNMFHETDRLRWKAMWEKAEQADGDWKELVMDVGKRVADESQYVYASYANPRIFHHVLTKMGFQYGVWPINYFNMITQRGIFNSAAKGRFWRRFIGTHGALTAAGVAAGVDMKDWAFFSPLNYTGGPYLQFGVNMLHALQGRPGGQTTRVKGVMGRMAKNFIPGLWKIDAMKAAGYMDHGDPAGAIMAMFRLKPWYDDQDKDSEVTYQ